MTLQSLLDIPISRLPSELLKPSLVVYGGKIEHKNRKGQRRRKRQVIQLQYQNTHIGCIIIMIAIIFGLIF